MQDKTVSYRYYGESRGGSKGKRSTGSAAETQGGRKGRDPKRVLLTEAQAGKLLQMSPRTLQGWRFRGGGPKYVQMGRQVRYRLSDLDEFVEQSIRRHTADPGRGAA